MPWFSPSVDLDGLSTVNDAMSKEGSVIFRRKRKTPYGQSFVEIAYFECRCRDLLNICKLCFYQ